MKVEIKRLKLQIYEGLDQRDSRKQLDEYNRDQENKMENESKEKASKNVTQRQPKRILIKN